MVPWGASCGPRSPSSFPSTLEGCAGPGLCAEYIWDPTLQIVQFLPLDCWLLLSLQPTVLPSTAVTSLFCLPECHVLSSGSSGAPCIFLLKPLPCSSIQAVAAVHKSGLPRVTKSQEGRVDVSLVPISQAPMQLLPWECYSEQYFPF